MYHLRSSIYLFFSFKEALEGEIFSLDEKVNEVAFTRLLYKDENLSMC